MAKNHNEKLPVWLERFQRAESAWAAERDRMSFREERLDGAKTIMGPDGKKAQEQATHVRNVCFEMVETQVDSNIPQPKVTALREVDEPLAKIAEDLLRNLLDRLPFERMNDEGERICPTQGGYALLVDWFAQASGRDWLGDITVDLLHPRKIIPQEGIYQVAKMDYIFMEEPQTKRQIKKRYGVDVQSEKEESPEVRTKDGTTTASDELVTLVTAFFRNEEGGIGRVRWVGETMLEYLEDYQVRRVKVCKHCGAIGDGLKCRYCGSKSFAEELQEYEELTEDLKLRDGTVIPAMSPARDEDGQIIMADIEGEEAAMEAPLMGEDGLLPQMRTGMAPVGVYTRRQEVVMEPTRIPYYKPDIYPIMIRKNVSRPGYFMGGSDIDALEDAQNTLNKLSTKIDRKVLGGGSFVTIPKKLGKIGTDGDNRVLYTDGPQDNQGIKVFNMQVDISGDMALRGETYEEGRQAIGVTDSLQGRKDPTATSKVAKEYAASRAAGRLESKRTMKNAVFQDLFEAMFKFMLAYADEPRPIRSYNENGEVEYTVFDRHDFLYQDAAGNWRYNTDFLFSVDDNAPLASNREAMWQETRMNFQQGAFGQPKELETLIRFWTIMEQLHYPMAKQVKGELQTALEEQRAAAQMQQMMSGAANMQQIPGGGTAVPMGGAAL